MQALLEHMLMRTGCDLSTNAVVIANKALKSRMQTMSRPTVAFVKLEPVKANIFENSSLISSSFSQSVLFFFKFLVIYTPITEYSIPFTIGDTEQTNTNQIKRHTDLLKCLRLQLTWPLQTEDYCRKP
jgi:hypothetical protein